MMSLDSPTLVPVTLLETLTPSTRVRGLTPGRDAEILSARWHGSDALEVAYRTDEGEFGSQLLYRADEARLELAGPEASRDFAADGELFRLVAEAQRISLAHLFDPLLAVHTSVVEPLPHQITAVYELMLPRQPLRFLLADDPGAGKTIMSGLFIKELIVRGDVERCLVVSPGSLAEQWQDELYTKFQLPFDIFTNEKAEAARSGNYFTEHHLVIARLDKLSRDEELQEKLFAPGVEWDLVIFDEAHKLSASYFGREVKYTKRYQLAQRLGSRTRHLLLLTATPHSGKEEDFQLFLALLDPDQFEGRPRTSTTPIDVSDIMRRAVKEDLLTFEGKPLFPERVAETIPFALSEDEVELYDAVTAYVREQFNRADELENKRRGTVGFALTVLQRRLASSPEAILQSLRRRRERLSARLKEEGRPSTVAVSTRTFDEDELDELDEASDTEFDVEESEILDEATAATTLAQLRVEIDALARLETVAQRLRVHGRDAKWQALAGVLGEIFSAPSSPMADEHAKLVVFTEHRDTLNYLVERISSYLGRADAVVAIHGGVSRADRSARQEAFTNDPRVQVLVATDAAGEGINLQRAHLMVNYDLPWNPNRLEQRFGRIHRIGQKQVCYLWNLVASETREGEVYQLLLRKLDEARTSLGGQVYDVLGKLNFDGRPLKDLLIEAIRYADLPEVRARLDQVVATSLDVEHLRQLISDQALASEAMDVASVFRVRREMELREARRLQPGLIESFFLDAFARLGGRYYEREPRRFEITFVPAELRRHKSRTGSREPVLERYERVVFSRELIAPSGEIRAAFLAPGHPLLQAVIDLTLASHRDLLDEGAVLVDPNDAGITPRALVFLSHQVRNGQLTAIGRARVISEQLLFVEVDAENHQRAAGDAPYLDYRPLATTDPSASELLARPECVFARGDVSDLVMDYAVTTVAREHADAVRARVRARVERTALAVRDRLTKEIAHWDHRAATLLEQEAAGKVNAKLNAREAQRRADELSARLRARLAELDREADIASLAPRIVGAALVIPQGLINRVQGVGPTTTTTTDVDRMAVAARARDIVMARERARGFVPVDREFDHVGYDVESLNPATGEVRFIEVKGRAEGAGQITVTRNELVTALNRPEQFVLAVIEFAPDDSYRETYLRAPFSDNPSFSEISRTYDLARLISVGIPDE